MSKFNEICQAFTEAHTLFTEIREDSLDFARVLWEKLIHYFEIPPTQISLYRVTENGQLDAVPPPITNAMVMLQDFSWLVTIGITVIVVTNNDLQETIHLSIAFKREEKNKFKVSVYGDEDAFFIQLEDEASFSAFFDHLYHKIINEYQSGQKSYKEGVPSSRKIGFNTDKK